MMKLYKSVAFLLLLVSGSMIQAREHEKKDTACKPCIRLSRKDFCEEGALVKPVVIDRPGNYFLVDDIIFEPQERGISAITIASDDVQLDLCGRMLSQNNAEGRAVGITLASGHRGVSIANGTIQGFTEFGILVEGGSSDICIGNQDTKLFVEGCGFGSIFGFKDDLTDAPLLQGGILLGQTTALQEKGYYTYQGELATVRLINVIARNNSPIGLLLGNITDFVAEDCSFSDTTNNDRPNGIDNPYYEVDTPEQLSCFGVLLVSLPENDEIPGFTDTGLSTARFERCAINRNFSAGNEARVAGCRLSWAWDDVQFLQCTFNENGSTGKNGRTRAVNAESGNGVLFHECTAEKNLGTYDHADYSIAAVVGEFDVTIRPSGIRFVRCLSNAHVIKGLAQEDDNNFIITRGFYMFGPTDAEFNNCTTTNLRMQVEQLSNLAFVEGFSFENPDVNFDGSRNVQLLNCHVADLSNNSTNQGSGIDGIFLANTRTIVDGCTIQSLDFDQPGARAASGITCFKLDQTATNHVIKNCVVSAVQLGLWLINGNSNIVESNSISHVRVGMQIQDSFCNMVKRNCITDVVTGIFDTALQSTNVYLGNQVFNADSGYLVTYNFPFPVVEGSLATGYTGNTSENLLITKDAPVQQKSTTSLMSRLRNWFSGTASSTEESDMTVPIVHKRQAGTGR